LTHLAVEIACRARQISGCRDLLVAGSDAPLEDCYSPGLVPGESELRSEHEEHIRWLRDAGCDLILIDTMNDSEEALIACQAASNLGGPFMVSMVTDPAGERILGGEGLAGLVSRLNEYAPLAILANCSPPEAVLRAVAIFARERERLDGKWRFGGYANGGRPDPVEGWGHLHDVPLEDYVATVERMMELGAGVVGSCCGTTPRHTRALRHVIDRK
jgi:homocysteine S-methyltransferase